MFKGHFAEGSVEGTGSAINVSLGFTPSYIKLYNLDDAGGAAPTMEWWEGMTAAHGLKNTTDTQEAVTSGGISQYAGSSTPGSEAAVGFTIGTDSDMNATDETIFYIAFGKE